MPMFRIFAYSIFRPSGVSERVVVVLRHFSTPIGYTDAIWAKYGGAFSELANLKRRIAIVSQICDRLAKVAIVMDHLIDSESEPLEQTPTPARPAIKMRSASPAVSSSRQSDGKASATGRSCKRQGQRSFE